MLHSQRLRETPLSPWVIVHKNGSVLSAHRDCMAGLGEACTHVATLLFASEANVPVRELKTVTQEEAYWVFPSVVKAVKYSPLADINFTSAKTKAKMLSKCLESSVEVCSEIPVNTEKGFVVPPPTQDEVDEFLQKLHATGTKSAVLTVTIPYSVEFAPSFVSARWLSSTSDQFV